MSRSKCLRSPALKTDFNSTKSLKRLRSSALKTDFNSTKSLKCLRSSALKTDFNSTKSLKCLRSSALKTDFNSTKSLKRLRSPALKTHTIYNCQNSHKTSTHNNKNKRCVVELVKYNQSELQIKTNKSGDKNPF